MPNREITRKNKKKYLKEKEYVSDEASEIKRFAIILISIIVIIVIIYFVSNVLVKKKDTATSSNNVTPGEIDYNTVSVGTILNREEDEYYVLVYDQNDSKSSIYATYGALYTNYNNKLKVYYCDLGNEINKSYVAIDGNSNPKAKNVTDFKFGEITLLKIKNKKINKYLEDADAIKKELGI